MAEVLFKATENSPSVHLDAVKGIFEISGNMAPEDVNTYYSAFMNWANDYAANPQPSIRLKFNLRYFNTSSAKTILDLLVKMSSVNSPDTKVIIEWTYKKDSEDMEEIALDYQKLSGLEFVLIPV